jgi:LuxR family maltose regulon positive regulatory protein
MTIAVNASDSHQRAVTVPISNSFEECLESPSEEQAMALLALSHSPIEYRLYCVMHGETLKTHNRVGDFGIRRLMTLTGLNSYSSIRRGCIGLLSKLNVESISNDNSQRRVAYRVFSPAEIFERRRAAGIAPYPREVQGCEATTAFGLTIERIVRCRDLSPREALVVLFCIEGLTNAEIGKKMRISEHTVKFHLRRIFARFGLKRRTELVSRLLIQGARQREEYKLPIGAPH